MIGVAYLYHYLICDNCALELDVLDHNIYLNPENLLDYATEHFWGITRAKHLCPACVARIIIIGGFGNTTPPIVELPLTPVSTLWEDSDHA